MKLYQEGWDDFYPCIIFKMGDGSSIRFWHDLWCEGLPLENIFSELFNITSNKEASMAELLLSSAALSIGILVLFSQFKIGS